MGEDGGVGAEGVHGGGDGGGHAVLGEARAVAAADEGCERVEAVHVQALLCPKARHRRHEHRWCTHRKVFPKCGCCVSCIGMRMTRNVFMTKGVRMQTICSEGAETPAADFLHAEVVGKVAHGAEREEVAAAREHEAPVRGRVEREDAEEVVARDLHVRARREQPHRVQQHRRVQRLQNLSSPFVCV